MSFLSEFAMNKQINVLKQLKSLLVVSLQVIILSLLTMFLCQFAVGCSMQDIINKSVYFLYIGLYAILFSIVFLFSGRNSLSHCVVMFFLLALSILDYQVYLFRGSEISIGDLNLIKTAFGIVSHYSFSFTWRMLFSFMIMLVTVIVLYKADSRKHDSHVNLFRIWFLVISLCASFIVYQNIDNLPLVNFENNGMAMNTFPLNILRQAYGSDIHEPDGYDIEILNQNLEKYSEGEIQEDQMPHIIVIMNESFADLSCLGDLPLQEDYIPYFHQLQNDSISGFMTVPAYGAGTANTEWEFLTGHNMHFLPDGIVPYTYSSLTDSYASIVRQVNQYGYHSIALHPYYDYMYTRKNVFPEMGFQEQYFIDDFPQENIIRDYISDQEMYEKLIDVFESECEDNPLFMFGITMQNHGPYDYQGEDFTAGIDLSSFGSYPKAEQYLTLMKESDRALQYLIEYFSSIDEEVVIAFFGDHLPSIEQEFYKNIGSSLSESEYQIAIHQVPFFIWSNQNNVSDTIEHISVNYFSNAVLESAGIPLSLYNQFLKDVYSEFPVLSRQYLYSTVRNQYITYDELSKEEQELIGLYAGFVYNAIVDARNRLDIFEK